MLRWNKALWLAIASTMTACSQSECFISAYHSYDALKIVYNIVSRNSDPTRGVMSELPYHS